MSNFDEELEEEKQSGCSTCGSCSACHGHAQVEEDEEDFDGTIQLLDEDGNEVTFAILGFTVVEEKEYMIAVPEETLEEETEELEVVVLRVEEDEEGAESYVTVTEDDEFDKVVENFKKEAEDEIDFVEDEK